MVLSVNQSSWGDAQTKDGDIKALARGGALPAAQLHRRACVLVWLWAWPVPSAPKALTSAPHTSEPPQRSTHTTRDRARLSRSPKSQAGDEDAKNAKNAHLSLSTNIPRRTRGHAHAAARARLSLVSSRLGSDSLESRRASRCSLSLARSLARCFLTQAYIHSFLSHTTPHLAAHTHTRARTLYPAPPGGAAAPHERRSHVVTEAGRPPAASRRRASPSAARNCPLAGSTARWAAAAGARRRPIPCEGRRGGGRRARAL